MNCHACASDLGVSAVGWAFCPKCGVMLSRRSTAQIRAAAVENDTRAILDMVEERYETLRLNSQAPDTLLIEGQRLVEVVRLEWRRRRDGATEPSESWRGEFEALLKWVRQVGEFKTR